MPIKVWEQDRVPRTPKFLQDRDLGRGGEVGQAGAISSNKAGSPEILI